MKKAVVTTEFKHDYTKFPKIYLKSIYNNIISYVLKYSQTNISTVIVISSEKVNDKVVLKFIDNGLEIDLRKHGRNMFKLNKIFHSGFDSKGVGLFMTTTQIETFGGNKSVEIEPNVGTEFTIEL